MKRIIVFAILIFFASIGNGLPGELTIRVPPGPYPPMFMQDESGKWFGFSIELAEVLLSEIGRVPAFKGMPFKRGLLSMETGEVDMMLNLTRTSERERFIHFIGPQHFEKVILVVPKDSNFLIASLDDLKKLPRKIGIERGVFHGPAFEEKRKEDDAFRAKLEEVSDSGLNAKKLKHGRISAFINNQPNMVYQIRTNPLFLNFKIHPFVLHESPVHFGFSRKSVSAETLGHLREAYDRAQENGLFHVVFEKYGLHR